MPPQYAVARRLCIRDISVLVTGQRHSEGNTYEEELCQLAVQRDGAAGGSEGVLLVAPTIVGVSLRDAFGDHRNSRAIICKGAMDCEDANGSSVGFDSFSPSISCIRGTCRIILK